RRRGLETEEHRRVAPRLTKVPPPERARDLLPVVFREKGTRGAARTLRQVREHAADLRALDAVRDRPLAHRARMPAPKVERRRDEAYVADEQHLDPELP